MKELLWFLAGIVLALSITIGARKLDKTPPVFRNASVEAALTIYKDIQKANFEHTLVAYSNLKAEQLVLIEEVNKLKSILINPNPKEVCGE